MNTAGLNRLLALSALMQDLRLAELAQANAARAASLSALDRLDLVPSATDLDPVAAGRVAVTYARWADVRRVELSDTITRQSVVCDAAQALARTAFGRKQALTAVAARLRAKEPAR